MSDDIHYYKSGNAYIDDPETWFKVGTIGSNSVTLANLEDTDSEKMYEVPDNFPVTGDLPAEETGTLTLDGSDNDGYMLDALFYKQMVEDGVTADLNYANEKINVGDFLSIYVSTDSIDDESDIYFGKITEYDPETGIITYSKSSAEEIESSMDLYVQPILSEETPTSFNLMINVKDSNYKGASGCVVSLPIKQYAPTDSWTSKAEYREEFHVTDNAFTITTPGQLAYLRYVFSKAELVDEYNRPEITYTLGAE